MATYPGTAGFLVEQLRGRVTLVRMFGEYAVKAEGKTLALLCDDALFVRQLPEVTAYLGDPVAGFPYPGARPWWRIDADDWEDADWLGGLMLVLLEVLPKTASKRRSPLRKRG